jgi:DNA-directed RNA polymerase subunit RPC12/RpoP
MAQGIDHGVRPTDYVQAVTRVGIVFFGDGIAAREEVRVRAHLGRVATQGCRRPCPQLCTLGALVPSQSAKPRIRCPGCGKRATVGPRPCLPRNVGKVAEGNQSQENP